MNKKIVFYNTENDGRYEYEPANEEEYKQIKREIEKDIATLFMGGISSEEIHLCKFGEKDQVNATYKLIRLNENLKSRYPSFSLDEYIEKYSDSRTELALIDTDQYLRKLNKKMIIKFITCFILGFILSLIFGYYYF